MKIKSVIFLLLAFLWISPLLLKGQVANIPTPKEHFGFNIGDDYQLANFTQTEAYFKKLSGASNRIQFVNIGETEEGRQQPMLIISSPENLKNLDTYKTIAQKLARAEISEAEAKTLTEKGKAVIWIDGGLHATEVLSIHQLIETAYQLASRTDQETTRILDNVIILLTHVNPDGHELVSNWYMRRKDPLKRSWSNLPKPYHKYIGHDNNRDFYMFNMKESKNIANQLFLNWFPQVVYNHHQTASVGNVVVGPPYRDPFNYVYDPIIMTSLDAVGAAMHNRLNVEGKPGYGQRGASQFSTWWNGGLRTAPYFRNMIGILTETMGRPTPMAMPISLAKLVPNSDYPNPILAERWHFKQSIDYSLSMNYAVLNYAVRYKDELLWNIYRMGRNSIERGSKDSWTASPSKAAGLQEQLSKNNALDTTSAKYINSVLKHSKNRDPRAYVLPIDQPDLFTVTKFLNTLIQGGVVVHRAKKPFTINGKSYGKGSYVVKTAQAFRPHILDMFEPQDHPNDFKYKGGPPVAPYDAAGWTLAYLMNVKFDRILDGFEAPLEALEFGKPISAAATFSPATAYLLSAKSNGSFLAVNRLLKQGAKVQRSNVNGDFYVPHSAIAEKQLRELTEKENIQVRGITKIPSNTSNITLTKVALWDRYGGTIPSGWLRWLMEQYHYDFTVIYAPEIDKGRLKEQYDVIILTDRALANSHLTSPVRLKDAADIPENYKKRVGRISEKTSIPLLKDFLNDGGRIVTIGESTALASLLNLPVKSALQQNTAKGIEKKLPKTDFYIPGSILRAKVDTTQAATWGMELHHDFYFDDSPAFSIANNKASIPLFSYDSATPLRSGWAWGQERLQGAIGGFKANVGKGELYAFGPNIIFRAQSYGTFKLLFNQLYK